MKQLLFFFIVSCYFLGQGYAQNTLVTPNFIQLPQLSAAPTCGATDKGKLYYNSTDNRIYGCNGSTWVNIALTIGMTNADFPFSVQGNTASSLFKVTNVGAGNALFTNGKLQFTGIGEGVNKILVSENDGQASWVGPIAFGANRGAVAQSIAEGVEEKVGLLQTFEVGGDIFSAADDWFRAPMDGIYHFDVSIQWNVPPNANNYAQVELKRCDAVGSNCVILCRNSENDENTPNQSMGITTPLLRNETVLVFVFQQQNPDGSRSIEGNADKAVHFTGYRVR